MSREVCKTLAVADPATLEVFDLREWFARDPLACVADCGAKNLLRAQEFPYRHWRPSRSKPSEKRFWDDLAEHLGTTDMLGDSDLASRFADYLVGYLLVAENQTVGRDFRPLRKILGRSPIGANPQRRGSLKSVLIGATADSLLRHYTRKVACEVVIPKIWKAIDIATEGASLVRTERRARNRRVAPRPTRS